MRFIVDLVLTSPETCPDGEESRLLHLPPCQPGFCCNHRSDFSTTGILSPASSFSLPSEQQKVSGCEKERHNLENAAVVRFIWDVQEVRQEETCRNPFPAAYSVHVLFEAAVDAGALGHRALELVKLPGVHVELRRKAKPSDTSPWSPQQIQSGASTWFLISLSWAFKAFSCSLYSSACLSSCGQKHGQSKWGFGLLQVRSCTR